MIRWSRPGNAPLPFNISVKHNILRIYNKQEEDGVRYQYTVTTSDENVSFYAAYLQVIRNSTNAYSVYIKVLVISADMTLNLGYTYGFKMTAHLCICIWFHNQDIHSSYFNNYYLIIDSFVC